MPAPYVPHYTPADLEEAKTLLTIQTPGKVEQAYRQGKLTLKRKLELQRKMNELQREIDIQGGATGEIKDYVQNVAKEFTATWEAAKAIPAAVGEKEGFNKAAMNFAFHGLMTTLEGLKAFDIPGNIVERWALAAGTPPGMARAMNWAIWIPANFLSISTVLRPVNAGIGAAIKGTKAVTGAVGRKIGGAVAATTDVAEYLKDPVAWAVKNSLALDSPEVKAAIGQMEKAVAKKTATTGVEEVTKAARTGEGLADPQAVIDEVMRLGKEFLGGKTETAGLTPEQIASIQAETLRRGKEFLMTPDELEKRAVDNILSHYAERAQAFIRKGVSHETSQAAAANEDILSLLARPPGQPLSAPQLQLVGKTYGEIKTSFEKVLEDSLPHLEDIAAGKRPDLIAAYKAHLVAMDRVAPVFLGGSGEVGRGLEFMKTLQPEALAGRMYDNIFREMGSDFLHLGNDSAISAAMGRLALLSKEGRDQLLKEAAKESPSGTLHTFYKHLLFANPATHVVNLLGSQMSILANATEKTGASFVWGGPSIEEAAANWAGLKSAYTNLPRIWRQAVERSTEDLSKFGLNAPVSKFSPAGLLGLEDDIMSGIAEVGLTRALATKRVMADGITDKTTLKNLVDIMLDDPVAYKKLAEEVNPEVEHVLFHDPLSSWGEMIARGIRRGPFDFLLPVVKFPINSLKMARDWTPGLQYLSRKAATALEAGGEAEARFRARQTISWMMANVVWDGAMSEQIGWGGPRDNNANKVWRQNNVPYHIAGLPMRWAEPFVTPIFAASDMAHLASQMRPENVEDFVSAFSLTGERMIENNYWLRIMEGVTNAITDVKQAQKFDDMMLAAGKVVAQPAITLGTLGTVGSPVSRRVREILDPQVKDVRDLSEYFISQVPGASRNIRPLLNFSAKPIEVPPVIGSRWLAFVLPPLRPKNGTEDPVGAFLEKHELTLPDQWKYYGGSYDPERGLAEPSTSAVRTNLDGDQSYNWKILSLDGVKDFAGRTWNQRIAALDADPEFATKTHQQKQDRINILYSMFRDKGWRALKQVDPVVAQQEMEARQMTRENRGLVPFTDIPDIQLQISPTQEDQSYGVDYRAEDTPSTAPTPPEEEAQ